jgi:hypothetical protein
MANKRIIILDKQEGAGVAFRVVLWAIVPTARVPMYAERQKAFKSAWLGIDPLEEQKFTAGEWTETVIVYSRPDGSGIAQAKADLQVDWQRFQDEVDGYNPWNRYGTFWDDTNTWTDKVNA